MSAPDTRGLRDEYLSAVECRTRLVLAYSLAALRGEAATLALIRVALEEADEAENQCRRALARAGVDVRKVRQEAAA